MIETQNTLERRCLLLVLARCRCACHRVGWDEKRVREDTCETWIYEQC